MKKWEYRIITYDHTILTKFNIIADSMNLDGLEGWELVNFDNQKGRSIAVFKRPLITQEDIKSQSIPVEI
jgi:hypothetical protein